MAIDFEAEGLLDGLADPGARADRLELLRLLEQEGFGLDELRTATLEDRLVLLPVERVLAADGPRYTMRELSALLGLETAFLAEARRALGLPAVGPDERVLGEEELELARQAAILLAAGLDEQGFLDLTRVMSQSMRGVAASLIASLGQALLRPGDSERELGLRYAETVQQLGPLAGPALQHMLNIRMREQVRQAVIGQAELESGHLPGSQPVVAGFVDIVGFTELGEQVPPDELGAVVREFERRAQDAAQAPVRLVKTIGDAALLVAPTPGPLLEAALTLVETSREDSDTILLRGGVASGEALQRAGDWYGRPVNLASRLTTFARNGSLVASEDVHDAAAGDGYQWSFAGRRRFRGVSGEVGVYRVRSASA